MRIGLKDIDRKIAQQAEIRLRAPLHEFLKEDIFWGGLLPIKFGWEFHKGGFSITKKRQPTPDERASYDLRKRADNAVGGWIAASITAFASALFAVLIVAIARNAIPALGLSIAALSAAFGFWSTAKSYRASSASRLGRRL